MASLVNLLAWQRKLIRFNFTCTHSLLQIGFLAVLLKLMVSKLNINCILGCSQSQIFSYTSKIKLLKLFRPDNIANSLT